MWSVAGSRRASEQARTSLRPALLLAAGITLAVIAWGYLVVSAIDFGATARHDGKSSAWALLAVASIGAMLCLFLGFLLAIRLSRALGLSTHAPPRRPRRDPAAPKGGKRAAR